MQIGNKCIFLKLAKDEYAQFKGIVFILYLHLINLKVTNSGLIYGIDLKGVLLPNFSPTHDPLNMRPIDR